MRYSGLHSKRRVSWAAALALATAVLACRDPTQVTLEVSTDVACTELDGTRISVGPPGDPANAKVIETTLCDADQNIGSLVVTPASEDNASIAFEVVAAVDGALVDCAPEGPRCIVARRALQYLPNTRLTLPIVLRQACIGVECAPDETCANGKCVPAEIDPHQCTGSGCPDPGTGGGGAGGAGGGGGDDGGWVLPIGGSGIERGVDVATGSQGVAVLGMFDTATLELSDDVSLTAGEAESAFVALYSQLGELLWATAIRGGIDADAWSLALGPTGVVVAGSYAGFIDIGGSSSASPGDVSAMVARLASDGTLNDQFSLSCTATCSLNDVAVGPGGAVYITGDFSGVISLPESNIQIEAEGQSSAFVVAFDESLAPAWATQFGSGTISKGHALAIAPNGDVVVSARVTYNGSDVLLRAYDSQGTMRWTTGVLGGIGEQHIAALAIGADGTIYATGDFTGSAVFGSAVLTANSYQETAALMAAFDGEGGAPKWAQSFTGQHTRGLGITLVDDEVLTSGYFQKSLVTDGATLSAPGSLDDAFMITLDPATGSAAEGSTQLVFGGGGVDRVQAVAASASAVYAIGRFQEAVDFTPLTTSGSVVNSKGNSDAVLIRRAHSANSTGQGTSAPSTP